MSVEYRSTGLDSPAEEAALVTPADGTDLPGGVTRGVSFATAGAIKVTTFRGTTVVIPNGALAAGIIHPLRVARIWSTGTTAANIVAYY